jgi:hypothetical protein
MGFIYTLGSSHCSVWCICLSKVHPANVKVDRIKACEFFDEGNYQVWLKGDKRCTE